MSRSRSNNWSHEQDHPSHDLLFLAMERELEERETERIQRHVESCWQCRAQWEKWQEAATAFVDFQSRLQQAPFAGPPRGWNGFRVRLHELAPEPCGETGPKRP